MSELPNILETITKIIEFIGLNIMLLGFLISTFRYVAFRRKKSRRDRIKEFRSSMGRAIIIGLEILVAATIVKTITVDPTIYSIGLLLGMIIIRTIISWTIATELEGHWPWQSENRPGVIADEVSHTADEIE